MSLRLTFYQSFRELDLHRGLLILNCSTDYLLFTNPVDELEMAQILDRITLNPRQCGGRPCLRGMRIRVTDVLDLFAAGLSAEQILEEMPDLEMDDLTASLIYASRKLNHPILVA